MYHHISLYIMIYHHTLSLLLLSSIHFIDSGFKTVLPYQVLIWVSKQSSSVKWSRQWGVWCVRWREVECVRWGEVKCVSRKVDPRLQIGARLDEELSWKSNWSGWSFRWFLSHDFRFGNFPLWGSRYYNRLLPWTRALLSIKLSKGNKNLVKNLPTWWRRLRRKTKRSPRIS